MNRTTLRWTFGDGYRFCQTKLGLIGVYSKGNCYFWQCGNVAHSGLERDMNEVECLKEAEEWYYEATHEYPEAGYIRLEPGQVVVDGVKLRFVLLNSKYPILHDGTCSIDDADEILKSIDQVKEARDEA